MPTLPISPGKFYGKRKRSGGMSAPAKKARMSKVKRTSAGKIKTSGRSNFLSVKRKSSRGGRRITNGISGLSYSITYLKSRSRFPKILKTISPKTTRESINPSGLITDFNKQGVYTQNAMFSGTGINLIADNALQKLNYLGVAMNASMQTGQKSFKIALEDFQVISTFTNQAPTSVEFEIYDLMCKSTSTNYEDPKVCWEDGIDDINQGASTVTTALQPYSAPTTSKRFNIAWKIMNVTKVELAAGRTHEHKFIKKLNLPIDTQYAAQYAQIKGVTHTQLIVLRGGLGDSNNNRTIGTVGFTAAKLLVVNRVKTNARLVSDNPRIYVQNSGLITTEPANVYVQDEGSGAVTDTKVVTTYA